MKRRYYRGRGLLTGILFGFIGSVALVMIIYGAIDNEWEVAACFIALAAFCLPLAIYALLPKVLAVDKKMIQYFVNKEKKFSAEWSDVSKIRSFVVRTTKDRTVFVHVVTAEDTLSLSDGMDFGESQLKRIFRRFNRMRRLYPDIEIEDEMEWISHKGAR